MVSHTVAILFVVLIFNSTKCDSHAVTDNDTTAAATLPSATADVFYRFFFSPMPLPAPPSITDLATPDSPSLVRHVRDEWRVPVHKGNFDIGIRHKGVEKGARISYESVADIWRRMESAEVTESVPWTKPQVDRFSDSTSSDDKLDFRETQGPITPEEPKRRNFDDSIFTSTDSDVTVHHSYKISPFLSSLYEDFNNSPSFTFKYHEAIEVPVRRTSIMLPQSQILVRSEIPTRTSNSQIPGSRKYYRRSHTDSTNDQETGKRYMIINAEVKADRNPVGDDDDILAERVEKPAMVSRRTRLRTRMKSPKRLRWGSTKQYTPSVKIFRSAASTSQDPDMASKDLVQTPTLRNPSVESVSTTPTDQTAWIPQDHVKFFEYFDAQARREERYENDRSNVTMKRSKKENAIRRWKPVSRDTRRHATEETRPSSKASMIKSGPTRWFDYPFMAMYIFEPEDVHCDAAAISPRWLVTSGGCLSRRQLEAGEEAPYVAYCGARWDRPRRINYVELELVHPAYERDRPEYNIGAVKVASSMEACDGWRPVGVWQHRLEAGEARRDALSVGWGLNGRAGAAHQHRLQKLVAARADLGFGACPGVRSRQGAADVGSAEGAEAGDDLTYCVAAAEAVAPPASCGGVLISGGRLLGLWLKEGGGGGDATVVYFSSVWRTCPWLRGVTRAALL